MSAIRKNVAGQGFGFGLVDATAGGPKTGATVSAYRTIDGGLQAAATGTVTEKGNGQYWFALSQADTNGNEISFQFVATGAVPCEKTIITTAADPTDGVRLGLTSLANAAAGSANGFPVLDAGGKLQVTGDVAGKILGGGASIITAAGVWALDSSGAALATAASQTSILNAVNAITTNTARGKAVMPTFLARPSAGSTTYEFDLNIYNLQGQLEAPDAVPTVHARDASGTSLDVNLSATTMVLIATGRYKITYTVHSADATGEVICDFTWAVGGVPFALSEASEVQDAESLSTLAAIQSDTDTLVARLTALRAGFLDNLSGGAVALHTDATTIENQITALGSPLQAGSVTVGAYAAGQDPWSQLKAAVPSNTPIAGQFEWLLRLIDADWKIDTTTTPWDLVAYVRGTATELRRMRAKDVSGANIGDVNTVLGQTIQ